MVFKYTNIQVHIYWSSVQRKCARQLLACCIPGEMFFRSIRKLCTGPLRAVPRAPLPPFMPVPMNGTAGVKFALQQPLIAGIIRSPNQTILPWPLRSPIQDSVRDDGMQLDSVMRKRKKKMKKHKLRKRRKREKAEKRKLSQGR